MKKIVYAWLLFVCFLCINSYGDEYAGQMNSAENKIVIDKVRDKDVFRIRKSSVKTEHGTVAVSYEPLFGQARFIYSENYFTYSKDIAYTELRDVIIVFTAQNKCKHFQDLITPKEYFRGKGLGRTSYLMRYVKIYN